MKLDYSILRYLLCIAFLVQGGCATMSRDECRSATRDTWISIGYDDGRHGRSEATIRKHQKACAGISSPDLSAYQQGHARGVDEYCIDATGYTVGLRGRPENSVCAGDKYRSYHIAHHFAFELHRRETMISTLAEDLQQAYQARYDAEYEIKKIEAELISDGLTRAEREHLLLKSNQLRLDLPNYDSPVADIEYHLQRAIESYNQDLNQNPYERRAPINMPRIVIKERPTPRPHKHDHHNENHPGENITSNIIKPERFIIEKPVKDLFSQDPQHLISQHIARQQNAYNQNHNTNTDSKGNGRNTRNSHGNPREYFFLLRFHNKVSMQIHRSSQDSRGVSMWYWNGSRYISSNSPSHHDRDNVVLKPDGSMRSQYLYLLVKSASDRMSENAFYATQDPRAGEWRSNLPRQ